MGLACEKNIFRKFFYRLFFFSEMSFSGVVLNLDTSVLGVFMFFFYRKLFSGTIQDLVKYFEIITSFFVLISASFFIFHPFFTELHDQHGSNKSE